MRTPVFIVIEIVLALALYLGFRFLGNDYYFFAGYTVLQFIVLATAWNILGGYCGYVNFGSAGFFAIGAYTSVCLYTVGQSPEELFPDWLWDRLGLAPVNAAPRRGDDDYDTRRVALLDRRPWFVPERVRLEPAA